jgi:hypothetical protein
MKVARSALTFIIITTILTVIFSTKLLDKCFSSLIISHSWMIIYLYYMNILLIIYLDVLSFYILPNQDWVERHNFSKYRLYLTLIFFVIYEYLLVMPIIRSQMLVFIEYIVYIMLSCIFASFLWLIESRKRNMLEVIAESSPPAKPEA